MLTAEELDRLAELERDATPWEVNRLKQLLARTTHTESGCWEYTGRRNQRGYGMASYHQVTTTAHRIVWAVLNGGMPSKDILICHRCDNPPCIRPDHLFAGTQSQNMQDCIAKRRKPSGDSWNENQREAARKAMTELQAKQTGKPRPWAKLTPSEVAQIRACADSQRSVAKRFGISQSLVCLIRQGKVWSSDVR